MSYWGGVLSICAKSVYHNSRVPCGRNFLINILKYFEIKIIQGRCIYFFNSFWKSLGIYWPEITHSKKFAPRLFTLWLWMVVKIAFIFTISQSEKEKKTWKQGLGKTGNEYNIMLLLSLSYCIIIILSFLLSISFCNRNTIHVDQLTISAFAIIFHGIFYYTFQLHLMVQGCIIPSPWTAWGIRQTGWRVKNVYHFIWKYTEWEMIMVLRIPWVYLNTVPSEKNVYCKLKYQFQIVILCFMNCWSNTKLENCLILIMDIRHLLAPAVIYW